MGSTEFFQWVWIPLALVLGWQFTMLTQLRSLITKTKDNLHTHEIHTAESYAKKSEVTEAIQPIKDDLKEVKGDIKELLRLRRNGG